jgi:hypothetical protein
MKNKKLIYGSIDIVLSEANVPKRSFWDEAKYSIELKFTAYKIEPDDIEFVTTLFNDINTYARANFEEKVHSERYQFLILVRDKKTAKALFKKIPDIAMLHRLAS